MFWTPWGLYLFSTPPQNCNPIFTRYCGGSVRFQLKGGLFGLSSRRVRLALRNLGTYGVTKFLQDPRSFRMGPQKAESNISGPFIEPFRVSSTATVGLIPRRLSVHSPWAHSQGRAEGPLPLTAPTPLHHPCPWPDPFRITQLLWSAPSLKRKHPPTPGGEPAQQPFPSQQPLRSPKARSSHPPWVVKEGFACGSADCCPVI